MASRVAVEQLVLEAAEHDAVLERQGGADLLGDELGLADLVEQAGGLLEVSFRRGPSRCSAGGRRPVPTCGPSLPPVAVGQGVLEGGGQAGLVEWDR